MSDHYMPAYQNTDRLFQFMIEKLTGAISVPDEQELDHLIETDAEVRKAWLNLQERFDREDLEDQLARFDLDKSWKELSFSTRPRAPKRPSFPIKKIAWAAAVLAGISIGGYLVLTRPGKQATLTASDRATGVAVQLQ